MKCPPPSGERGAGLNEQVIRAVHGQGDIWNDPFARGVLDAMSDLFIGLDRELRIVFVNRALNERANGAGDRFLGMTPWQLWPALEGTAALQQLRHAAETGRPTHFEHLHEPSATYIDVTVVPNGEFLHAYFRDVTEGKLAESELRAEHAATERWRALFDQTTVCLATTDVVTGRLIQVNKAYEKLTGYSEAELRSMTYLDLTHPDDREENVRVVDKVATGEVPATTFRKRYVRKDGGTVWVEINASLIRDSDGAPLSFAVVTHDITELIALEEQHRVADVAVRRSEQRLRKILETSTTGVVLNDKTGKFLYANAPLLRLLDYSVEDVEAGRLCWDLVQDPVRRAEDDRALEQLRQFGYCDPFETELVRRDGSHVPVYMGGSFVPDDSVKASLGPRSSPT